MERIYLGNSGIEVSRICMGTMTMGGQADEGESLRMLDRCFDHGVDFFDTANMYNAGASEQLLGRWVKAHAGRRQEIVIASKVFYQVGDDPATRGLSRRNILKEIDKSLARLGTDYLDIYYLHAPDHHTALDESLLTMDLLVRSGRVRTIGMSNYAAWQLAEAWLMCDRNGWARPTLVQPMYNLIARDIETEILPCCRRFGLATCAYNPLAGGLLTAKHDPKKDPEAGGRFATNRYYRDRYWHEPHFDAVRELEAIARDDGRSLVGLAYRWLLDRDDVSSVILGASSFAQLEANLKALEERDAAPLGDAVTEACDAVHARLRGYPPRIVR